MSGPLLRYLARRYAPACALCALAPVVIGSILGLVYPDFRTQMQMADRLGILRFAMRFLRDDLVAADSSAFFFQLPFMHPLTILALITAMALPALALPAGARGRGSLDLLLATPLTRRGVVATSFAFTLPFAALHALAPMAGIWIGGSIAGVAHELPFAAFARVCVESAGLAVFFAGLASLLSAAADEAGGALKWLTIAVFWSLLAEVVATTWSKAEWLKPATPFGWFEPPLVISGAANLARDASVLAGGGLALFAGALIVAQRRRSA